MMILNGKKQENCTSTIDGNTNNICRWDGTTCQTLSQSEIDQNINTLYYVKHINSNYTADYHLYPCNSIDNVSFDDRVTTTKIANCYPTKIIPNDITDDVTEYAKPIFYDNTFSIGGQNNNIYNFNCSFFFIF